MSLARGTAWPKQRLSPRAASESFRLIFHATRARKADNPAPRTACPSLYIKTIHFPRKGQVASLSHQTPHRNHPVVPFRLCRRYGRNHTVPQARPIDVYFGNWQGQQGSNPRPAVLETAALPTELYPFGGALSFTKCGGPQGVFCLKAVVVFSLPTSRRHRLPRRSVR